MDVAAVVRTRGEVRAVVDLDQLGNVAGDGSRYVIASMAEPPGPGLEHLLATTDPGDDRYAVSGREPYAWCPHGQQRTAGRRAARRAASRTATTGPGRRAAVHPVCTAAPGQR